jgi:hypothetical protein
MKKERETLILPVFHLKKLAGQSEFKAKVVLESLQRDTTIEEVRRKYGVSSSMIHRWRQEYN